MNSNIRILYLDALLQDAAKVQKVLNRTASKFLIKWVTNRIEFMDALAHFVPDIVLSEQDLPDITAIEALKLVRAKIPNSPFILITSSVSEEVAANLMETGVTDYILKDRLQRLPLAIRNGLDLSQVERQEEIHYTNTIQQERKYKALIENISDGIVMVNESGQFIYHSPSVSRITGFDNEDFTKFSILDLLPLSTKKEAHLLFADLIKFPGSPKQSTFQINHKDGHKIWIESSFKNLLHDNSVNAIIMNFRDITERKRYEQQRENSEAKLKTIFYNTKVAYVLIDSNFRVMSFNPLASIRYARELGVELSENFDFLPYLQENRDPTALLNFKQVLTGEKINYEIYFDQEDGGRCWYQVSMFPVSSDTQQILGLIIASEDITARKLSELEREKMTSDLLHHVKDLEQFAYIVSHNLRSPVVNIRGLANLLQDHTHLGESDFAKCLDGLGVAANKLDGVITDLNYILQTRREIDESKELVHFDSILDSIETSLEDQILKQEAKIIRDFEIREIFTLKSYLYSILVNLIGNALKYRRPEITPEIKISTSKVGENVIIIVSDNGLGIDLEKHGSKIFGLYKKFHQHIEGKGMGLYMVKTQVEILGGSISIESVLQKGTTFKITL